MYKQHCNAYCVNSLLNTVVRICQLYNDYIQSIKQQDEIEEKKSCNQLMLRQEKGSLLSTFAAGIYTEILKCTLILTYILRYTCRTNNTHHGPG